MGEVPGKRGAMPTRARRARDVFAALFFVSVAVFCVLVAVVLVPAVDAGEEESAVVIVSVLALVVLGLCAAAAGSLNGLARMPVAVTVLGTLTGDAVLGGPHRVVLSCRHRECVGATVWSYRVSDHDRIDHPRRSNRCRRRHCDEHCWNSPGASQKRLKLEGVDVSGRQAREHPPCGRYR